MGSVLRWQVTLLSTHDKNHFGRIQVVMSCLIVNKFIRAAVRTMEPIPHMVFAETGLLAWLVRWCCFAYVVQSVFSLGSCPPSLPVLYPVLFQGCQVSCIAFKSLKRIKGYPPCRSQCVTFAVLYIVVNSRMYARLEPAVAPIHSSSPFLHMPSPAHAYARALIHTPFTMYKQVVESLENIPCFVSPRLQPFS